MASDKRHKVLVGSLIWVHNDNYGRDRVVPTTLKYLLESQNHSESVGFDLLLVDNDSNHPDILKLLQELSSKPNISVKRFTPQLGWGSGRNYILYKFMQNTAYSKCVMLDQDIWIKSPLWINKILELEESDPELHAYMIQCLDADKLGEGTLPSGKPYKWMREFLGGANVVDRYAVEKVGGYDMTYFPGRWAFHDVLYGRQLMYSGVLNYVGGRFIDPLYIDVRHVDPPIYDIETGKMRERMVARYGPVFARREAEVKQGINIKQDLIWPPGTDM
jgi:glycosyltransferase involved in cell wall biosynthesis